MGGEAHVFKNRKRSTVEEMSILHGANNTRNRPRWMKMAFGENPKRDYGSRQKMPKTRMGVAWLMRHQLEQARKLKDLQDQWCASTYRRGPFPQDLRYESLVALLRHQVYLNVHVYETNDIETLLRISHEFKFPIAALHHATSAHLVADLLAKERLTGLHANLTLALFSDKGYYKAEAYHASMQAHSILYQHKIPFAIKSDHPVTNAQFLLFQAAKVLKANPEIPVQTLLASITSVPAAALHLDHRIGSIQVGFDADIVVWEGRPIEDLNSQPCLVLIDGVPIHSVSPCKPSNINKTETKLKQPPAKRPVTNPPVTESTAAIKKRQLSFCAGALSTLSKSKSALFLIEGLTGLHLDHDNYLSSQPLSVLLELNNLDIDETLNENFGVLQVDKATLSCADETKLCLHMAETISVARNMEVHRIRLEEEAYAVPAPIFLDSRIGLKEIGQEASTKSPSSVLSPDDMLDGGPEVRWSVGNTIGSQSVWGGGGFSKIMENWALEGGAGVMVVPPGTGVVLGRSSIFHWKTSSTLKPKVAVDESTIGLGVEMKDSALHIQLGSRVATPSLKNFDSQINYLRHIFRRAAKPNFDVQDEVCSESNAFQCILESRIPLAVHVNNADQILAFLQLKQEIESWHPTIRIRVILVEASEAWMVAKQIKQAGVEDIILSPVACVPESFESKRCQSLSSLMHPILFPQSSRKAPPTGLSVLWKAGLRVAVAPYDDSKAHEIWWEAGWARHLSSRAVDNTLITKELSLHEAVGMVTWNIRKMLLGSEEEKVRGVHRDFGRIVTNVSWTSFNIYVGGHPVRDAKSRLWLSVQRIGSKATKERYRSLIRCSPRPL